MNYRVQSGDYTNLRKLSYGGLQHISLCPNTIKVKAQLNANNILSVGSYTENEVNRFTIGAYTDALYGQRIVLSKNNNFSGAYWQGRVRTAWTSTQARFNEMSINNPGDDYIFVIDDYPIMEKLINLSVNDNQYYVDWDIAFRRMRPIIGSKDDNVGLKGCYAGYIDPATSKFRITISAYFLATESAATISSWSVNKADGTLVAGSLTGSGNSSGSITLDFPSGFRHILLTATDNGGRTTTLPIRVWAEPRTGSSTLVSNFGGSDINFDLNSVATCTFTDFDTDFSGVLNNTLICVWDEEYIDEVLGSIGGNVRFLGRLRKSDNKGVGDLDYGRILETPWTLESVEAQINRLDPMKTFNLNTKIPPVIWGDIQSMNPYRVAALLMSEFTTLTESLPINFDTWDDTFPYPAWNTAGSTMLEVLNDVGLSINAKLQFAPDGRIEFNRHAFYLSSLGRSNLHTFAAWDNRDLINTTYSKNEFNEVSLVDAWGAEGQVATPTGPAVIPQHAAAPGQAREPGERSLQLNKQILANVGLADSQTELNNRAANHREKEGLPERLVETHPDQYGFITPSNNEWVTQTLDASVFDLEGISFNTSTRWIVEKVHQTHSNEAFSKTVDVTYLRETDGTGKGKTLFIDDPSTNVQAYPATSLIDPVALIPSPALVPPGPDVINMKVGLKLMAAPSSGGNRYTTTEFDKTVAGVNPIWASASLGVSGTVVQWVADPFSTRLLSSTGKTYGWIVTTTGIYYGELNTPSFSIFFSFRASSSLRSADVSKKQVGHIAVITDYGDGVYATAATRGGDFFAEVSVGTGGGTRPPGCKYSDHYNDTIYTSISGGGKFSNNNGATWSTLSTLNPGGDAASDINFPLMGNATDSAFYYGWTGSIFYDFTTSIDGEGGVDILTGQNFDFTLSPNVPFWIPSPFDGPWIAGSGWSSAFISGTNRIGLTTISLPYYSVGVAMAGDGGGGVAENEMLINGGPLGGGDVPMDGTLYTAENFSVQPPGTTYSFDTRGNSPSDSVVNYATKAAIQPISANAPLNRWARRLDYTIGGVNRGYWVPGVGYTGNDNAGAAHPGGPYHLAPIDRTFSYPISPSSIDVVLTGALVYDIDLFYYDANRNFLGSSASGLVHGGTGISPIHLVVGVSNISYMQVFINWTTGARPYLQSFTFNGMTIAALKKYTGLATLDVSPAFGFGPWKSHSQIAVSPTNSNILACVASNIDISLVGLWISTNGGKTWKTVLSPGNTVPWTRCFFSNDGKNALYLVGLTGQIAVTYDLGSTILNKLGNISTSDEILGIAGL